MIKKLVLASLLFSIINLASFAQDSTQFKRQPYKLKVLVDKEAFYEDDLKETPYVWPDNTVQVYPGESIFIEAEVKDGVIEKMTAVKENKNPGKTLVITFTQVAKGEVHELMMLKISNPFDKVLTYDARMFLMKHNKWAKTNVLPVQPGLVSYESWPDVIITLGLGNWKLKN